MLRSGFRYAVTSAGRDWKHRGLFGGAARDARRLNHSTRSPVCLQPLELLLHTLFSVIMLLFGRWILFLLQVPMLVFNYKLVRMAVVVVAAREGVWLAWG